ncbi:rhodanese-like domain-containing protein [Planctomycetaceae bacterium]|nr:rhodanese-like domain-containing protein [Planctomycetaceae bacterium]
MPDDTLVYPAHGAGSLCGKNLSDETVSTIGEQKKYNYALQPMSKEEFMDMVRDDQPDAPEYFVYDAIKNREERVSLEESMKRSMIALSLEDVLRLRKQGAQVVDVREGIDFDAGHLSGVLNVGLQGKYATWAGSLLSHDEPIVVIAEEGGEEEAIMRLGRIGFDNVVGYLGGGVSVLDGHPELTQSVERITAPALQEKLEAAEKITILDVRSPQERESGTIENSISVPLNHLAERISEVPQSHSVVVHCAGGYRSAIAISILQQQGYENVLDLVGGFKAWEASNLQIQTSS